MSYIFEVREEWVWSPAHRVGELYVGMAEAAAAVLRLPTGLETDSGDQYEIDVRVSAPSWRDLLAGIRAMDPPMTR